MEESVEAVEGLVLVVEFGGEFGVEEAEEEGDHGSGSGRVVGRVGLVEVIGAVEGVVEEGVEFGECVGEEAEFGEGEDVVGEVGEVFVGFGQKREGPGMVDFVDDRPP